MFEIVGEPRALFAERNRGLQDRSELSLLCDNGIRRGRGISEHVQQLRRDVGVDVGDRRGIVQVALQLRHCRMQAGHGRIRFCQGVAEVLSAPAHSVGHGRQRGVQFRRVHVLHHRLQVFEHRVDLGGHIGRAHLRTGRQSMLRIRRCLQRNIFGPERRGRLDLGAGVGGQQRKPRRIDVEVQPRSPIGLGHAAHMPDHHPVQLDLRAVLHHQTGPIGDHRDRYGSLQITMKRQGAEQNCRYQACGQCQSGSDQRRFLVVVLPTRGHIAPIPRDRICRRRRRWPVRRTGPPSPPRPARYEPHGRPLRRPRPAHPRRGIRNSSGSASRHSP
ncbi:hypothetical protein B7C42_07947 [Nocardia cerradoensis]|uniref:Uncharacterized protein n=1 Tax=Nocardia cerradoensis TaxID=85688 RepID=A0A231GTR0_9NOCA|nr:hypothetical protein B7C42_07947 [Nocardia cerradoensis]